MPHPLRRVGRRAAALAWRVALAYVGLCALMFALQRHLLFHPTAASAEAVQHLPRADGGEIFYAAAARPADRAVLYLPGNAEDPGPVVRTLAGIFPDHAVYGLHYRGYAGSSGEPSEEALRSDAAAWLAQLRQRHPHITLIGRSLGSGVAVRLASEQPVDRMVLVTPYDSILEVAAGHYPWLPTRWLLRDRFEAWKDAARVRTPTLLLVAANDTVIPPARGQALYRHFLPGVAQLHTLAGTDHGNIVGHPDFMRLLQP